MKNNEMKEIEARLDNIESVLKMLLVNSVLNETDTEIIRKNAAEAVHKALTPVGLGTVRLNYIENKHYAFAEIDPGSKLPAIKRTYSDAAQALGSIPLVLVFQKLHPRRRKTLEKALGEAKISYCMDNGELRIF